MEQRHLTVCCAHVTACAVGDVSSSKIPGRSKSLPFNSKIVAPKSKYT